ncbi:MAG TPA: hypothetical protein VGA18_05995 [Rhodothermales bacterium]|jgi:ABC-type nitrate/sulfonate/bicarbonate transport system permease component
MAIDNRSDHDILIRLETRVEGLEESMRTIRRAVVGGVIAIVIGGFTALLTWIINLVSRA